VRYREQRLPAPLDAFIECVWFLTASAPPRNEAPAPQRILPDGCVELVCHFADRFLAARDGGTLSAQPACFVAGVLTSPLVLLPARSADTMGVRFRPGSAYRFLDGPISALTNRTVRLADLWGCAATDLWEQLAAAASDAARVDLISGALCRRLARLREDRMTAFAVGDLVRSAGRTRVASLSARAGITSRHLQRRFAEQVGTSPKVLARILRFQNTLRLRAASGKGRADWVRIALACGYADQSHLIHDYASFAGETPASLLAAEGELSSYFTAPQRLAALFDGRWYA